MRDSAQVLDDWADAVDAAFREAKGRRRAELHRSDHRRYDSRGVEVFSWLCGRASAFERELPELAGLEFTPRDCREEGYVEAEREFRRLTQLGEVLVA